VSDLHSSLNYVNNEGLTPMPSFLHCYKINSACGDDDNPNVKECIRGCDHQLGLYLLTIPPWKSCFWGTDKKIPLSTQAEGLYFLTIIPESVHRF
jgi:hypothetical protein